MMQLTMQGKTYQLHFGIEFIRQIDRMYEGDQNGGAGFGFGVSLVYQKLVRSGSPVAIADLIRAATATDMNAPSAREIEEFLIAEETDLTQLTRDFYQALQEQPLLGKAVRVALIQTGQGDLLEQTAATQSESEAAETPTDD